MLEAATAFPWAIGAKIRSCTEADGCGGLPCRTQDLWPEAVSPRRQRIPEKPDSLEGQKVSQAGDVDMMRLRLKVSTFTKRFAFGGPEPIYG